VLTIWVERPNTPDEPRRGDIVATRTEATMSARRILTFRELKPRKGWPYSRQHTHRLIRAGRFPRPRKLPGGGLFNIWDEDVIDAFLASITDADDSPPDAPR
jgi:predicted DNA-binding transcriptional regulator AlpA